MVSVDGMLVQRLCQASMIPALVIKHLDPRLEVPGKQCGHYSDSNCKVSKLGRWGKGSAYRYAGTGHQVESGLGLLEPLQCPAAAHALLRMLQLHSRRRYMVIGMECTDED